MGLWGKQGAWSPAARPKGAEPPKSGHRLPRGAPDEIFVMSFCEQHAFTQAKLVRQVESGSVFLGDCGCEILHGGFYVTKDDGRIVEAKVKPALK